MGEGRRGEGEHAGHDMSAMGAEGGEMEMMAHEMGHGGGMSMEDLSLIFYGSWRGLSQLRGGL